MLTRVVVAALALLIAVEPAVAQYSFVSTRAAIGGTGFIDWSAAGANMTDVSQPFNTAVTNTSLTATVSQSGSSDFQVRKQQISWFGPFTTGDNLLWTRGNNGPMTIMFDAAVSATGANFGMEITGPYVVRVSALDALGNELFGVDMPGVEGPRNDGSALFLGVASTNNDIRGIRFTGVSGVGPPNSFAINSLQVNMNVVPEPSTVALSAAGLLALAAVARRRRRTVA